MNSWGALTYQVPLSRAPNATFPVVKFIRRQNSITILPENSAAQTHQKAWQPHVYGTATWGNISLDICANSETIVSNHFGDEKDDRSFWSARAQTRNNPTLSARTGQPLLPSVSIVLHIMSPPTHIMPSYYGSSATDRQLSSDCAPSSHSCTPHGPPLA